MRNVLKKVSLLLVLAFFAQNIAAQMSGGSWLDQKRIENWNAGVIPVVPRNARGAEYSACREQIRQAENINDRALNRAGWFLYGATEIYSGISLVKGLADFDGACRPMRFQVFVFNGNRFVGTLSPTPMDSRTDGFLTQAELLPKDEIRAEFARYKSGDALCCPSNRSVATFEFLRTTNSINSILQVKNVVTENSNQISDGETPNSEQRRQTIRGTVAYRERIALSNSAVVRVKIADISNPSSPVTIAETEINGLGRQVPIPFELSYETARIQPLRTYGVIAEILNQGTSLFITERPFNLRDVRGELNLNLIMSSTLNQGETSPIKPIRGVSLYLSEYGRGSLKIANRAENVNRAVVQINTDSSVTVDLYRPRLGRLTFAGDLIGYDEGTIRVRVYKSGNADASGQIVIKHRNRRVDSVEVADLILDGQNVTFTFAR